MNEPSTSTRRLAPIKTPQSVIVAATLPTHQSALLGLLQAAGLSSQHLQGGPDALPQLIDQNQVGDLDEVSDWMTEHPTAHLVLLVRLPEVAVARRLGEGMTPKDALAQWLESAETVLTLVRRYRRRISLLFAEQALADPAGLMATLNQRLQLDLHASDSAVPRVPELPGAVLRMMAENAIWQSTEARNVAAELAATALPLDSGHDILLPAIDQVFAEYRQSIDTPAKAARELREENKLLLEQMQRVQQKMEAYSAEKQSVEQRLASAEQHKTELEKTRQKLQQARQKAETVEELKEENELLLAQLHQVQEELESQFLQSKQARKAVAAPDHEAQLKDLQEENELLLQQLHHVQEELEHYYLQSSPHGSAWQHNWELQAAHDTIRAIYNSYSWRLTKPLRWVLRVFGAAPGYSEKAPLPDTVWEAQDTIQALYNSKSWKITKPLRKVLDLFTGGSKAG